MNLYKATGISGIIAFVCIFVSLFLNPMDKNYGGYPIPERNVSGAGNISLIISLIAIAIFIVLFVITLIHHKVESKREGGVRTGFNPEFNVFTSAGKYDEETDTAEKNRRINKEKQKFD